MCEVLVDTDQGQDWTERTYDGKIPSDSDYDQVISARELDCDVRIYGPANIFGDRPLIAGLKRRAFTGEVYDQVKSTLDGIDATSTLRHKQSGPWDKQKLLEEKGWVEGEHYILTNPNAMIRKKRDGTWDTVAHARPIKSLFIGYRRGRFTGEIALDAWSRDNPDKLQVLLKMCSVAEQAYKEVAPEAYEHQVKFGREMIGEEYLLSGSMFSSLSANKYEEDHTESMGYHVDAGDLNTSLTCLSVFRVGEYTGGMFVLPRYRIAIDVGDGDVMVGDSRQIHGVTPVHGTGRRLSCVSYLDTRIAKQKKYRSTKI